MTDQHGHGDVTHGTRAAPPEAGAVPRHVLRATGAGLDLDRIRQAVDVAGEGGFTIEELRSGHDPRTRGSFRTAAASGPVPGDGGPGDTCCDRAAVGAHGSVAYVLSPPVSPATAWHVSRQALAVTTALLAAGATAVRNEASGAAWGRARWVELAAAADGPADVFELAAALRQAWVVPDLRDGGVLHSRGMHLLGEADVELEPGREFEPGSLKEWVDTLGTLAYYLLSAQPGRGLHDGDGFRVRPGAPRWVLRRTVCERYGEDSFLHNPYGYWRLVPG